MEIDIRTRALVLIAVCNFACSDSKPSQTPDDVDVEIDAGRDVAFDVEEDVEQEVGEDVASDLAEDCTTDNGCILRQQFIGTFSRETLQNAIPPEVEIDNGYSIYWIDYRTDGRTAHASVTIPIDEVTLPDAGWSIAVNNPGTVGVGDDCAIAYSISGSGLSGYFGSRNFVGVTIDYPGLGTEGLHPYLDKSVEARATLDAIRAVQRLLEQLNVPSSGRAVVAGLSQGGHATLATASEQPTYAPELDIAAYAAVAPASGFLEHWQPGMGFDGPHLVYHAWLTYAWWKEYGDENSTSPWAESFVDVERVMEDHCIFPIEMRPELVDVIGTDRTQIFSAAFRTAFLAGDFSDFPFMADGFERNRLVAFDQTAPIRIYQGDADVVVLESGTSELVAELRSGNVSLEYIVVPQGTHTDVAFSFLAQPQLRTEEAISWLRAQVEPSL